MAFYILLGLNILLAALLVGAAFLLSRAGKIINDYEDFYNKTLTELEQHILYVRNLIQGNVILSNDDSVKKIYQSMKDYYYMLCEYFHAGKRTGRTKTKAEGQELFQ